MSWVQVYNSDHPWRGLVLSLTFDDVAPPLYYAASVGLSKVVDQILQRNADVNAQGGRYGNALQAASEHGHEQVVQILLDAGGEVNAQGGWYGNALYAASEGGHEKLVQILLGGGAEEGGWNSESIDVSSLK